MIDIDPRHGGDAAWAALVSAHGPIPTTPTTHTGGGGLHLWVSLPEGTRCGKLADGIDLKADGGYVILPPSRIAIPEHEGRAYTWAIRPWEADIIPAPAWVVETLAKPKASNTASTLRPGLGGRTTLPVDPWVVQPANTLATHPGSPKGERRRMLCELVGRAVAEGRDVDDIWREAEAWAGRCTPSFDEWAKHVRGVLRKEGIVSDPEAATFKTFKPETIPSGKLFPNTPEADAETIPSFPPATVAHTKATGGGVNSFLPTPEADATDDTGTGGVVAPPPSGNWPVLHPDAYHGLFGEMLRAVEPETEADPSGILLTWLTAFGNIVGRGAWFQVGPRRHHPALYVGIVGRTSDAKGDSWGVGLYPFRLADPVWVGHCIANGIGSGEGLIERVADPLTTTDRKGNPVTIPGASDKRCLVRLSELSRCFKVGRRESSTLSEHMREMWDGEPIHLPNRSGNALSTTGYSLGVVGDITPDVLRGLMANGTEAHDGWANRFLWWYLFSAPAAAWVEVVAGCRTIATSG